MVTVQKSEIFQSLDLAALGKNPRAGQPVAGFQRLEFKVLDHSDLIFVNLLKDMLDAFLKDYKVYLVFVESAQQPRSAIRTHKKLFYQLRNQKALKPSQALELEISGGGQLTLMAGILSLDAGLLHENLEPLINSNLRFIYMVNKEARSFRKSRADFLEKIVHERSGSSTITAIEMGKLLPFQKNILNIKPAVGNTDAIELFIRKDDKVMERALREVAFKYRSAAQN